MHRSAGYGSAAMLLDLVGGFAAGAQRDGDRLVVLAPDSVHDDLVYGLDASLEWIAWEANPCRALGELCGLVRRSDPQRRTRVLTHLQAPAMGPRESREWARIDSVLNLTLAGTATTLCCLYDERRLDAAVVSRQQSIHPEAVSGRTVAPSRSYLDPQHFFAGGEPAPWGEPGDRAVRIGVGGETDLRTVRAEVRAACDTSGVGAEQASDFVLAVNEIVSNSVSHGGGSAAVLVWTSDGEIVCEVADEGPGIAEPFPGYLPPDLTTASSGGMGMWLARQLCDHLEVRSGRPGCAVRLHLLSRALDPFAPAPVS